ncbi:hypothetical protein [Kallotenue papyrolyticum]|uniref:hypothetical protein n=1 Tax=Kallotenue papyrolyticum TaxID=1325125 RepID=UPI000492BEBE|nr:hypothetical protein [Kallotenue papyrolyticum]
MPTEREATAPIWLGYSGLSVAAAEISAVLRYQPLWDRRIAHNYGSLPAGIRSVVLLKDGRVLPSRRTMDDLRRQWQALRAAPTDTITANDDRSP